ncbi:Protein MAIN-LIKE 2 [Linum grandiflorum]
MEQWRPETNTFHMYHREVSITLQDVAHLTGLSVSGDALYVEYEKETNWAAIVEEVLGKSPGGHMKDDGRVQMKWLHDNFYTYADIEDRPELRQYACTYMLSSIGAFLMPDQSSAYVHCQYLLVFREQQPFAWDAVVLSWMYRGRAHEYINWRHWWMDGATAGMVSGALPQHCTEDARARPQMTLESDSTSYSYVSVHHFQLAVP